MSALFNRRPLVAATALFAVAALSSAVHAQTATFNLGTFTVDDNPDVGDIPLSVPAGTYTSYTFSTDWSSLTGGAQSVNAIWAITDAPLATATTFYADPGLAPNSAPDTTSRTLNWSGFLDTSITSPPSDYFLLNLQAVTGTSAQWANTVLTLGVDTPTAPASTPAMEGGSITTTLAAGEVQFYSFVASGGALTIDTEGSSLATSNDTELGLYDSNGVLVDTDDDGGTSLLSLLTFAPGELTAGETYYLAAGAFNTTYGGAFNATSTSTNTGTLVINGVSLAVPEPTSLALLGLGGLAALRRRRA